MKYPLVASLLAAAALAAPLAASAQQLAYTAQTAEMRAGPDGMYPIVAVLPAGAQVAVQGCLPDYRWCDVTYGFNRGWVYGGNLSYAYQQGYVTFPGIAPYIGVAILGFALYDYWDHHYQDRPWYGDRDRWARQVPPRPYARPGYQPRITNPPRPGDPGYVPHAVRPRPPGAVQPPPPQVRPAPQGQVRPAPGARIVAPQVREPAHNRARPSGRVGGPGSGRDDGRTREHRPGR